MLKPILIAIALMFSTTAFAQDFSPREPKKSQKQASFMTIPNEGRSGPGAPDVRWDGPVEVVNVCGDRLLSVGVGAVGGLVSVDFLVDSFAADQTLPASLVNGRWEANWVMPCEVTGINHHNYQIKAVAVGANDTYTVAIKWYFTREPQL